MLCRSKVAQTFAFPVRRLFHAMMEIALRNVKIKGTEFTHDRPCALPRIDSLHLQRVLFALTQVQVELAISVKQLILLDSGPSLVTIR